jgi:hypothetical protein
MKGVDDLEQSDIIKLFIKERDYETCVFGDYKNNPTLNLASFITFLKIYLDRVEKAYAGVWSPKEKFPDWLKDTVESKNGGTGPVEAYENLIKLLALAGAALEAYAEVDVDSWRRNPELDSKKWNENKSKGEL